MHIFYYPSNDSLLPFLLSVSVYPSRNGINIFLFCTCQIFVTLSSPAATKLHVYTDSELKYLLILLSVTHSGNMQNFLSGKTSFNFLALTLAVSPPAKVISFLFDKPQTFSKIRIMLIVLVVSITIF